MSYWAGAVVEVEMRTETITINTVSMQCGECGVFFWVTSEFHRERKENGKGWFCPNGHSRVYRKSDVDELKEQLLEERSKLASAQFELMAAEKKIKRIEKRVKNGMCPCCNRQFTQLARHMKSKHPDYAA